MEDRKIARRLFSGVFIIVGAIIALIGAVLWTFNLASAQIHDLPSFLVIIGGIVVLYGVWQLVSEKKLGKEVDVSRKTVNTFLLNNAIILALGALVIVLAIIETRFIQMRVLRDILAQSSTRLIIALGISFTLLIGGTDLSAGRIVGLAAVISASMMQTETYGNRFYPDLPQIWVIIPVLIAIAICLLFGLLNGFVVANFNLPPFIGTLAVMSIVYGVCSLYFNTPPNNSQPIGGIRPDFAALGQTLLWGKIPVLIPIAALFTVFVWFLLNHTVFGKNVYALGGNRQAAVVSGINVKSVILTIFVLAAGLYAVGGVLEASRTAGATNNYGFGYELDAIAACVVGGVSLNGGVGKVKGIVIGVLVFTVIQYGLSFIKVDPYWQQIIKGIIIVAAVALDLSKYSKK